MLKNITIIILISIIGLLLFVVLFKKDKTTDVSEKIISFIDIIIFLANNITRIIQVILGLCVCVMLLSIAIQFFISSMKLETEKSWSVFRLFVDILGCFKGGEILMYVGGKVGEQKNSSKEIN